MDDTQEDLQTVVVPRFGRKGKTYRRRTEVANQPAQAATSLEHIIASDPVDNDLSAAAAEGAEEEQGLSVSEVLRLRQARRARLGGVGFRVGKNGQEQSETNSNDQMSLVRRDDDGSVARQSDVLAGMTRRFAPQTGLIGDLVNKHM
jgi:hypothetical protein